VRILVVEDDAVIASLLRKGLEKAGFEVEVSADGPGGLRAARAGTFGLIVLDVMLPGLDGWRVCEALRERRDTTPILMLTARDSIDDRVRGLEGGADDYLPKPFDFKGLLARVRALLRRDKLHKTRVIRIADLEIDTAAHRVVRGGQEIQLTPREYSLLEALAVNEGRVLTRDHLPHVCKRFYSVDAARTGGRDGTGLGLAIFLSIVQAHGGTLCLESEPGLGTTVTVSLPCAGAPASAEPGESRNWTWCREPGRLALLTLA
jgi:DNA-binding response OmpR family regulator